MQSKEYSKNIKHEIEKEKDRKENLTKRVKQLENQIDGLLKESLSLLKVSVDFGCGSVSIADILPHIFATYVPPQLMSRHTCSMSFELAYLVQQSTFANNLSFFAYLCICKAYLYDIVNRHL